MMYTDIEARLNAKIESLNVLKSGWAGEIVSLKLQGDSQKYVVKTYQSSKNGLKNIKQEWDGLNFLYRANYPVPKPILCNFEHEKPYILMEEIAGKSFWTIYQKSSKPGQQKLLADFVWTLYCLHRLDSTIADRQPQEESTLTFVEQELREIETLIDESHLQGFLRIIDWLHLEGGKLAPEKLSILHRDYHPWNVIVDHKKKIYVLDLIWGLGDYRFDLAWLCTLMERSGFEDFSQAALIKYKEFKPGVVDNFEYFKVLATLRWLVNVTISLRTGENLNQTRNSEFLDFVLPLIKNGIRMINQVTRLEIPIWPVSSAKDPE